MTMKNKFIGEQAAFIVDKYLSDNNFLCTRQCFRNEASLFARSPIHEAPKNLMTLNEMLEEYISLKEQKETMDKEKANLEHAKNQILMHMNTYNVSGLIPPPAAKSTLTHVPQPAIISNKSHPGVSTSGQNKFNTQLQPPSSISNISSRKRKDISDMDAPSAPKHHHTLSGRRIPIQGINVTMSSQIDTNISSMENSFVATCDGEAVPTSYNAISCKRVMASPTKQMASKETSHCISPVMTNSDKPSKISDHEAVPTSYNAISCKRVMASPTKEMASKETSHCISPVMTNSDKPSKISDHEAVPTSYNAISCKRVMASPTKQMASKETSHCISPVMTNSDKPSKSDHEESMLGFDSADVPESLKNQLFNEISTPASENQFDNSAFDDLLNLDDLLIVDDLLNVDDLFNSDDDDIYKLIDFSS
ncbi:unnamed protein product [Trifolium pratense]|uniref:Uncharacterized protein n=1 Tax=Trifolium pratense TaxID=57577 RepID=A0ACB0LPV7_TRIPR|nr:unnamed protein product [Trifolium pratense]